MLGKIIDKNLGKILGKVLFGSSLGIVHFSKRISCEKSLPRFAAAPECSCAAESIRATAICDSVVVPVASCFCAAEWIRATGICDFPQV